uniref:Uncharacterized protein n=1 Tax=Nelumbo nucifera TaxID=4432 RepID=A0A822YLS2_NELNU|nr:TPA_asm: hypothetical protein HUJ06_012298 [Nelumbo nucifera]
MNDNRDECAFVALPFLLAMFKV